MECCTQDRRFVLQSKEKNRNNIPLVMGQNAVIGSTSKECFSVAYGCVFALKKRRKKHIVDYSSPFILDEAGAGNAWPILQSTKGLQIFN